MWLKRFSAIFLFSCLAGLSLLGQVTTLPETPEQNLTPNLTPPDGLWTLLLEQTQNLPMDFDNYEATLNNQVASLKISNASLTKISAELKISNADLTNKNVSLTESLKQSEAKAGTLEAKSTRLQTELDASMRSITQAQVYAKALEAQIVFLKVGCVTLGVGCAGLIGYEVGRYYKLW